MTTTARMFLSTEALKPYFDKGEPIPIDFMFSGVAPSIHYNVPGITEGALPIEPWAIQKEIFESGKRYLAKWNLKSWLKSDQKKAALLVKVFVGILAACAIALFFFGRRN